MPFLTVITRHMPKRAEMLHKNSESLLSQLDQDYERILVVDEKCLGVAASHMRLAVRDWSDVKGDYVIILDDDDMLAYENVIDLLKFGASSKPDLIITKMNHGLLGILPRDKDWGRFPERWHIGVSAVVPSRAVFVEAVKRFEPAYDGDYGYIAACFELAQKQVWLPVVATRVQQIGAMSGH